MSEPIDRPSTPAPSGVKPGSMVWGYFYNDNPDIYLGDFIQSEDGYYNFWPDCSRGGYWSAHLLRDIADRLDKLNKPWDDQVQQYFKDNPPSPSQETPNP